MEKLQNWGKGVDEKDSKHPRFQIPNVDSAMFQKFFKQEK